MNRQGFTLLELAVVLAIPALLTHLAVRKTSRWRSGQLREMSNRGLLEIKEAVVGSDFERDSDGARVRTGFLADLGRLPQAVTNQCGRLSLAELWASPSSAGSYAAREAVAANLVPGSDAADADADVVVPGGWRGPYLRLPLGKTRLLDAWGNAYEVPDDANYSARLCRADGAPVAAPGDPVVLLRHLGADGIPDELRAPESEENQDLTLNLFAGPGPDAFTNATLTVTVNAYDADGNPAAASTYSGTVRVYGPRDGQIAVCKQTFSISAGTAHATVSGLTPGPRVLRVECNGHKGLPRLFVVQPGANSATDRLKVN
jgi:prepilin-type N-terminal cleavage/methylation domain-containing protein